MNSTVGRAHRDETTWGMSLSSPCPAAVGCIMSSSSMAVEVKEGMGWPSSMRIGLTASPGPFVAAEWSIEGDRV